jgi:hypothetical protein
MVVIDTMVLAAGYTKDGADNDTATTNAVLLTMSRLAVKAGCFVFGVDHFGKNVDVGTRGNSVKEGNADVVLALLGDKGSRVRGCRLFRAAPAPPRGSRAGATRAPPLSTRGRSFWGI